MKSAVKTKQATKRKSVIAKPKGKSVTTRTGGRGTAVTVLQPLSASAMKTVLWDTLLDLRHENIQPNRADAIAAQSREILRTIKTQLQVAGQAKRSVPQEIIDFSENRAA